jgi:molecular chaperone DnaJ
VLSDPKKRSEYDEARQLAASGFRMPGTAGPGPDFDFGDIFRRAGGTAGDFGETLSGCSIAGVLSVRPGADPMSRPM